MSLLSPSPSIFLKPNQVPAKAYLISFASIPLLAFLFFLPLSLSASKPSPRPTATPAPASHFSQLLLPTPTPAIPVKSPPPAYQLPASNWIPQTFNNCGPATISMLLQHFGHQIPQSQTQADLRTSPDDRNVFTSEISSYLLDQYGVHSKLRYNGNLELLKTLLANDFYIFTETFLHPNDDIGHTLLIRGYDDKRQVLITDDSYFGGGTEYPYATFDQFHWKPFNREFMPVYLPEQEPLLQSILTAYWDDTAMYTQAVADNLEQTQRHPDNPYDWFNLGSSYFGLGDSERAQAAYATSRSLGWPSRMLWYQTQPIETALELQNYHLALELAHLALKSNDAYPEAHYLAAQAYLGLNQTQEARQSLNLALRYYPNYPEALSLKNSL